jgi:hypothetical protein
VSLFIFSRCVLGNDYAAEWTTMTVSGTWAIRNKVHEFRERAMKAKLKADATEETIAKRMFEDAAQQFDDMADNLEKHGRTY